MVNNYTIYIMYCAIAIIISNAVAMSSSFILLHLDYLSRLLCNKKYIQNLLFLKFSSAYLSYSVKYKFLLQCKIEISVFSISTTAEGWGGKEVCTKGVCDRQKEGEGRW